MKYLFIVFSTICYSQNLKTPFENGNGNQTATYQECIAYYTSLASQFETIQMQEMGLTDSGEPLHIISFSANKNFDYKQNKAIILINNGIHPGEPDGIDASMQVFRDLATAKIKVPKNTIVVAIPIYNIGGSLNRGSHSRANQNGPEAYGFRGNARNYDLNRDFIKSDSKNSRSFQEIYHLVNPDMFIDNHCSNGADYQYIFTCIATQHQRLGGDLGLFYKNEMHPQIMGSLKKKKIESIPYVNIHGDTPDQGFAQFMDTPRYATGYTTLFNSIGSVPETHMLKPYKERVFVTYEYMIATINYVDANFEKIKDLKAKNLENYKSGMQYALQWEIDSTKVSYIDFKGYKGAYKPSAISGKDRLYYDRKQPFTKNIPFYNDYKATKQVVIPSFYVVPKSEWQIIELLKLNKIVMQPLEKETEIEVETYKIDSFETTKSAYEGHYLHYNTEVTKSTEKVVFAKGDLMIATQQVGVKYLLETLEPEAVDSFFNWNFFDSILQQKEYFSAYVFEDLAKEILDKNPKLKAEFEDKKQQDKKFAANGSLQLDWVYKNSPYYENSHLKYPIYRIK